MEVLWFSLIAVLLYLAADAILRRIEVRLGRTLEYRSLVFFALLLVMAMASFALIRSLGSQAPADAAPIVRISADTSVMHSTGGTG